MIEPNTPMPAVAFDQHFLVDEHVIARIVSLAHITREDTVLEVGAGQGRITRHLAGSAGSVIAVEIDHRFKPELTELCRIHPNVRILWGDALAVAFPPFDKMVANLPYSITEPFLRKLARFSFSTCVFVTGARFGFTVASQRPCAEMTWLGTLVHSFFHAAVEFAVPSTAFLPRPRTTATVVSLKPKSKTELLSQPVLFLFRELHEQSDKKLKNALRESLIRLAGARRQGLTKNEARARIASLSLPVSLLDRRIDELSNDQIRLLTDCLATL